MKADHDPVGAPLERGLNNRHLQLISIGGAIGSGLFLGSSRAITLAGPSILLSYALVGLVLFFVLRAMGELLLSDLTYRSFADFIGTYLGERARFFTGWTYWMCWIVTGVADVIAVSGYTSYWFPELALWIPAVGLIISLLLLNLPTVRSFGEIEFWFSLIKVTAIIGLIVLGLVMLATGYVLPSGSTASIANLWAHGGLFPNGFWGFVAGFQIAVFAFVGIELIGTAAAEAQQPEINLPKAINAVPARIGIFYVGTLFVIMTVLPWNQIDPSSSPFVTMFSLAGLGAAAHLINFVVLTAAASSANSGVYSTSRIIYGLATSRLAPNFLSRVSRRHVPVNALFFSCIFLLSGVVLLYSGQGAAEAFTLVTTISALLFIFVWSMILAAYVQYRRVRPELNATSAFRLPGGRWAVGLVYVFFACTIGAFAVRPDTALALKITPAWFILLGVAYVCFKPSGSGNHRGSPANAAETRRA